MKEYHAAFTAYLSANSYPLTPSSSLSSKRRTNLATLDSMALNEFTHMATDVFDEMSRRQSGNEEFLESQAGMTVCCFF
jgi:hypothetical protein